MRDQRDMVRNFANGVRFACMGTCNKAYPREELNVSEGRVFCASCYPATAPAPDVNVPHKRVPQLEWRKN